MPRRGTAPLREERHAHLQQRHHQEPPGPGVLGQQQQTQPADLAQQHTARVAQGRRPLRALGGAGRPQPLRRQGQPHDHVAQPDHEVVVLLERPRDPRREDQHTRDLHQRDDPVQHVVVVVRRGEPREVHPGPPHGEEDHRVVQDPLARMALGDRVHQLDARLGDGHDEAQVEEELQRRGRPVRLVASAGPEPAQRSPVAGRAGGDGRGSGAGRHDSQHNRRRGDFLRDRTLDA